MSLLLLLFLCSVLNAYSQQDKLPVFEITSDHTELFINTQYPQILVDSTGELTLGQVLRNPENGRFENKEVEFLGLQNRYWIRFRVHNLTSYQQNLTISFSNYFLSRVEFFELKGDSIIDSKFTGYEVPYGEKEHHFTKPSFSLILQASESKTIYLKVPGTVQVATNVILNDDKTMVANSMLNVIVQAMFFGILGALMFYNLILWTWTRAKNYLIYISALFAILIQTALYDGWCFAYSSVTFSSDYFQIIVMAIGSIANILYVMFITNLLSLKSKTPYYNKVLIVFMGLFLFYIPLSFYDVETAWMIQDFSSVLIIILTWGVSVYLTTKKYKPSYYISLSLFILILSFVAETWTFYDPSLLETMPYLAFSFYFGVAMETMLFSLGLAHYIKILRIEKETLAAKSDEREQELYEVREHYTTNLEEEVKQRTLEIDRQNQKLEKQSKELKELDAIKSRFFTNLSHELRTPLTLLTGHIQATIDNQYGDIDPQVRRQLASSKKSGDQILSLIEEILELSKLDAKATELKESPVELFPLVNRLCDMFGSYMNEKELSFQLDYKLSKNLILWMDEGKFSKVLGNLLANSSKYTNNGGEVVLTIKPINETDKDASRIQVTVMDSGRGIAEEDIPRVFDRYFQTSQSSATAEGGTGIGLALAKELVQLMGGEISIKSELGKGSTFVFNIPYIKSQVTKDPSKKNLTGDLTYSKNETISTTTIPAFIGGAKNDIISDKSLPTILLVEDHTEMRSFIRMNITSEYNVIEAGNGVKALGLLEKHEIDLVLTDVMMPEMDGFQLLEQMKRSVQWSNIPVIMLTARAAQEDKLQALTTGVDDYLTKPFEPLELSSRINYVLNNYLERKKYQDENLDNEEEAIVTADQQFLEDVESLIKKHLDDSSLSVPFLAEELKISQSKLFSKVKSITGLSPLQYISEIRLQTARELLETKQMETVGAVMKIVGFQQNNYFAKVYKKRFGKLPSAYLN